MDGDNLEGIELKPGESAAQALANFRERVVVLEKEKKIRTVRIVKKEMSVLDVSDEQRIVRVRLHLIMTCKCSSSISFFLSFFLSCLC
jgi:hypothetical protein